jgi:pimeloyl-ACP methyl ester carboxylesterase
MVRSWLLAAFITFSLVGPVASASSDGPPLRIVAPADGSAVTLGDTVLVEVALDPSLRGSLVSARVDGKSIWVSNQQPYRKPSDSAKWGVGRHVLEAAVLRDEGDIRSRPITVHVLARDTGRAAPRAVRGQSAPRSRRELPVWDDFNDAVLDNALWGVSGEDAGIGVREWDNEVRVAGVSTHGARAYRGVHTGRYPHQSLDASIYFRSPVLSGLGKPQVSLMLHTDASDESFHLYHDPELGYCVGLKGQAGNTKWVEPYGDETRQWHQLRVTYDADSGTATGYVDDYLLGGFPVNAGRLSVSALVGVEGAGNRVDVRFDDFALVPLQADHQGPAPTIVEEEPRWERDPYVGAEAPLVRGQVVERRTRHGDYFEYVPLAVAEPVRVAVVVHGSYGDQEMGLEISRVSARGALNEKGWLLLADTMGVIIVAPSFDRERFYGYRYLWGSPIGADQFVLEIVDGYRRHFPSYDGRLFLFGHSAGGQFANRFLVTHPDRVIAAALSSSGTYAYPDDSVEWPFGRWNSPNPQGFLTAAALPVKVIAGSFDAKDLSDRGTGQRGNTAVARAEGWVDSMQTLAYENGVEPGVHAVIIPAAAHSAWEIDINVVWWFAGLVGSQAGQ